MSKAVKVIVGIIVLAIVFFFMPFITVTVTCDDGSAYVVPFLTSFVSKTEDSITFSSLRSGYALEKDADNAFYSYGESSCYGTTYFYDEENDISYSAHSSSGFLPTRLTYSYVQGNACEGWSEDDEVAWEYGSIDDVDFTMTKEDALEQEGYFVIADGSAQNISQYNDFSRLVKQGVYSYLRTMIYENDELVKIVDIQLLSDAKFRVRVRTADETTDTTYVRFSDLENEDGSKDVSVYEKSYSDAEAIILFTVK